MPQDTVDHALGGVCTRWETSEKREHYKFTTKDSSKFRNGMGLVRTNTN